MLRFNFHRSIWQASKILRGLVYRCLTAAMRSIERGMLMLFCTNAFNTPNMSQRRIGPASPESMKCKLVRFKARAGVITGSPVDRGRPLSSHIRLVSGLLGGGSIYCRRLTLSFPRSHARRRPPRFSSRRRRLSTGARIRK